MTLILLAGDPEGPGCFALLLALLSVLLCLATLPLSLIFCVKVTPVLSSPSSQPASAGSEGIRESGDIQTWETEVRGSQGMHNIGLL